MKKIDSSRHPIGKHEFGKIYSLDETRKHIKTIAGLPKDLKKALKKISHASLDKSYRQGGWTVRQVVHHLADSHMNAYIRMKLAVTEHTPVIKTYEEALWAETEDGKKGSVKLSLKLLSALNRRWVIFLESLSDEDLERGYFHPEMQRVITLPDAIALYAWHSRHHLAHIGMVVDGAQFEPETFKKVAGAPQNTSATAEPITAESAPAPKKRGPKAKAKPAASSYAAPKKRGMSPEHMAKIREARMAKRAAAGATAVPVEAVAKKRGPKPKAQAAAASTEVVAKKRGPKPKAQSAAASTEVVAKKRGPKPKAQSAAASTEVVAKKRGPKPKAQAAASTEVVAKKRGPKPKAQAAAATTEVVAKKRGPKPKAQAAASTEVVAKKRGPKPKAQAAAATTEVVAKKRGPKPKAQAAAVTTEVVAKKRGPKPKAQAAAASTEVIAKKRGPKPKAQDTVAPMATAAAKRGPKPKAKIATTSGDAEPKKRGMSPEHMAKIREARMAKRAAAGLPVATPKAKAAPKTAVQPKTPAATSTDAAPKKRGMSPEHMAKIREARMAKLAAAGGPKVAVPKVKAAPKTTPKPNAKDVVSGGDAAAPKKRGMSPEHMAKIREARMAKLAAKKAG